MSVAVNSSVLSDTNFSDTTPPAPEGAANVKWQYDGSGNVSANVGLSNDYFNIGPPTTGVFSSATSVSVGPTSTSYGWSMYVSSDDELSFGPVSPIGGPVDGGGFFVKTANNNTVWFSEGNDTLRRLLIGVNVLGGTNGLNTVTLQGAGAGSISFDTTGSTSLYTTLGSGGAIPAVKSVSKIGVQSSQSGAFSDAAAGLYLLSAYWAVTTPNTSGTLYGQFNVHDGTAMRVYAYTNNGLSGGSSGGSFYGLQVSTSATNFSSFSTVAYLGAGYPINWFLQLANTSGTTTVNGFFAAQRLL